MERGLAVSGAVQRLSVAVQLDSLSPTPRAPAALFTAPWWHTAHRGATPRCLGGVFFKA